VKRHWRKLHGLGQGHVIARGLSSLLILVLCAAPQSGASRETTLAGLLRAYPEQLDRIEGNTLVWKDGTRMPLDDGKGEKAFETWLADPDIEDMLAIPYPAGDLAAAPKPNSDPGRARNAAFFNRMYGDCRRGEVQRNLVTIRWLPKKANQSLRVTRINGVAERLVAVSRELDELPPRFDRYLLPAAGGYNCRRIAGADRISAHGHGIAIDIALRHAHYWRSSGPEANHRNALPFEVVRTLEKHGFIWGGKWYHYDTMHFEYRPELLPER
jgi:hypothetical protein